VSRLLITGGSGYLGRHLVPLALAKHKVLYTYFSQDPAGRGEGRRLDIRDATAVAELVTSFAPDAVIHTAGSNRGADMQAVIEQGTVNVSRAAAQAGSRLIHLSTDSIFAGRGGAPYGETAVPTPVNLYGRAKTAAEASASQHPDHVIIRTSLIYGLEQMDHGTEWMARALNAGQPVTLFTNQIRNPIWVQTLALACLELVNHPYQGILNIAGRQVMTRAEFGLRLLDYWSVVRRETLQIGPSSGEQWPLDCALDLKRSTAVLQTPLLGVDEVLDLFL
jgi:dTDP-4-dehydrorhamnose reductase